MIHTQFSHLVRRINCNIATKLIVIDLNEFFNQLPRRCLQPFVFRYSLSKMNPIFKKCVYCCLTPTLRSHSIPPLTFINFTEST